MFELYELTIFNGLDFQVIEMQDRPEAIEACERLRFFFKVQGTGLEVKLYFSEYEEDSMKATNSSEICMEKEY